jgi:hypothetical protein
LIEAILYHHLISGFISPFDQRFYITIGSAIYDKFISQFELRFHTPLDEYLILPSKRDLIIVIKQGFMSR